MSSQTAMSLMSIVEFGLWALLGFLFWSKNLDRRFPAMGAYLGLRLVSMPVLLVLFYGQAQHWFNDYCLPVLFLLHIGRFISPARCCCSSSAWRFSAPRFRPSPGCRGSEPWSFAGPHWSQPS